MSLAQYATDGTNNRYSNLIGGDFPIVRRKGTLISGQNLAAGAALGVITASGKLTLSASASVDGSQTIDAILLEACDASGGDKECIFALSGEFIGTAIVLGAGHTLAAARTALRARSIFLT